MFLLVPLGNQTHNPAVVSTMLYQLGLHGTLVQTQTSSLQYSKVNLHEAVCKDAKLILHIKWLFSM